MTKWVRCIFTYVILSLSKDLVKMREDWDSSTRSASLRMTKRGGEAPLRMTKKRVEALRFSMTFLFSKKWKRGTKRYKKVQKSTKRYKKRTFWGEKFAVFSTCFYVRINLFPEINNFLKELNK